MLDMLLKEKIVTSEDLIK